MVSHWKKGEEDMKKNLMALVGAIGLSTISMRSEDASQRMSEGMQKGYIAAYQQQMQLGHEPSFHSKDASQPKSWRDNVWKNVE